MGQKGGGRGEGGCREGGGETMKQHGTTTRTKMENGGCRSATSTPGGEGKSKRGGVMGTKEQ